MKKIAYKNRIYAVMVTSIITLYLLSSCVFKNNKDIIANETKSYDEKIFQNQIDAQLLVDIAELNLTTIDKLNRVKINEFNGNKEKFNSFKKYNYELKFDIQTIATKKLITIPNQYDVFESLNNNQKNDLNFLFNKNDIDNAIKAQSDLFTRLQQNTSDTDILQFSLKAKERLKEIDVILYSYKKTTQTGLTL